MRLPGGLEIGMLAVVISVNSRLAIWYREVDDGRIAGLLLLHISLPQTCYYL